MASTVKKRKSVVVSSSYEEYDDEEEEEEEESFVSSSGSAYDDDDDDYADDDDEEVDEEEEVMENNNDNNRDTKKKDNNKKPLGVAEEGEVYNRVVNLLSRGKDLSTLRLEECKAYLRKNNLRVTGTKAICIQRIQEHWRIKDGNAERLYPRSSFNINCMGDVCNGDVILFKQRVYEKFDIVTRGANIIGKRTIAGRVVKESYGAAKQQHTFTVEILWSKGVKALPALFPLLVKGRNLYKLKTFRQCRKDEDERAKVLLEKHQRGAAARQARAVAKARHANRGPKRWISSRDTCSRKRRKEPKLKSKRDLQNNHNSRTQPNGAAKTKRDVALRATEPSSNNRRPTYPNGNSYHGQHSPNSYNQVDTDVYHMKSAPTSQSDAIHRQYAVNDHHDDNHPMRNVHGGLRSSSTSNRRNYSSNPFVNHSSQIGPMNSRDELNGVNIGPGCKMPSNVQQTRTQNSRPCPCSAPGCRDLAAKGCVVSCCSTCCRREGRSCRRHK